MFMVLRGKLFNHFKKLELYRQGFLKQAFHYLSEPVPTKEQLDRLKTATTLMKSLKTLLHIMILVDDRAL